MPLISHKAWFDPLAPDIEPAGCEQASGLIATRFYHFTFVPKLMERYFSFIYIILFKLRSVETLVYKPSLKCEFSVSLYFIVVCFTINELHLSLRLTKY